MERLQTQCKALDALSDGGLATGTITQVFGEKALGKSILSLQAAFATAASGHSAIILDTEQSYSGYLLPYWETRMNKRFEKSIPVVQADTRREPKPSKKKLVSKSQLITALSTTLNQLGVSFIDSQLGAVADILSPDLKLEIDVKEPSVIIIQVPEITDLLALHGVGAAIEVSPGGRVELQLRQTPIYHSILHRIVSGTNAKLLVYDSISAPLKAIFTSTSALPARSSSMAMMLMHAQRLCIEFQIAVLATSHVSIDPIQGWNRIPYGGVILGHEAKFSFELTKQGAKRNENAEVINPEDQMDQSRQVWVQRHPAIADYSKFGYFTIREDGMR
jgi:RecA/RadA recombinase